MIYKVAETNLTMGVVKSVYAHVMQSMSLTEEISIDLTQVEYLDTAGIAVILAWWQYAVSNNVVCHFKTNDIVQEAVRLYQIELP